MSFAPLWGRGELRLGAVGVGTTGIEPMDSTPAVGSCALHTATASETSRTKWDRFNTQWFSFVESKKHSAKWWSEIPRAFEKASGTGLEPVGPCGL